ncbi:beta-galactosidase [Altererythrobacter sp. ZODW24]|uniref:beta-galactosidase n=1 Tax=Altererythrobacter sp. ZODW24 TaxID=2185142 RepID=UPI001F07CCEA|nr:beta-galactosidase [Altererythrobacter sp. ZODW24]
MTDEKMRLGVCYYPEHWPEERWAIDAARMAEIGLSRVRIGEFAWSRIEPEPGRYDWSWLDRALRTLADAGLGIIFGTPTATPPKWLVDQMPDMIAVDASGKPRKFGSRRHYCFSHRPYRDECARITQAVADRYGKNPAVVAWQTDNEYGCHNTTLSYSDAARDAFRDWLAAKYGDVSALNTAWGNVFWSMEYRSFGEIELPNLTVTEPNPAHVLDFRRFASDEVVSFNKLQANILRAASPGRDIVHNFMGFYNEFDHHDVSADLDVASWDSYPLGFLEMSWMSEAEKIRYARQGHPDISAFHHDLYRGCKDRWWVMEQQPGPVNWAPHNPAPLPGMVRFWTLEALSHGAELVSFFRWRQAAFAQEQMHSGLLRPDASEDGALFEAEQVAGEITALDCAGAAPKRVALIYSYEAQWLFEAQPQGQSFVNLELMFSYYTALRRLGLDVDIVSPDALFDGYAMIVAPSLPIVRPELAVKFAALTCPLLLGPRSGSKTENFAFPDELPPGPLQELLPVKVMRVESLREGIEVTSGDGRITRWLEHIDSEGEPEIAPVLFKSSNRRYLGGWADAALLRQILGRMADEAGLTTCDLPQDIRIRSHGGLRFAFNHGPDTLSLGKILPGTRDYLLGGDDLPPAGVAAWRE